MKQPVHWRRHYTAIKMNHVVNTYDYHGDNNNNNSNSINNNNNNNTTNIGPMTNGGTNNNNYGISAADG